MYWAGGHDGAEESVTNESLHNKICAHVPSFCGGLNWKLLVVLLAAGMLVIFLGTEWNSELWINVFKLLKNRKLKERDGMIIYAYKEQ